MSIEERFYIREAFLHEMGGLDGHKRLMNSGRVFVGCYKILSDIDEALKEHAAYFAAGAIGTPRPALVHKWRMERLRPQVLTPLLKQVLVTVYGVQDYMAAEVAAQWCASGETFASKCSSVEQEWTEAMARRAEEHRQAVQQQQLQLRQHDGALKRRREADEDVQHPRQVGVRRVHVEGAPDGFGVVEKENLHLSVGDHVRLLQDLRYPNGDTLGEDVVTGALGRIKSILGNLLKVEWVDRELGVCSVAREHVAKCKPNEVLAVGGNLKPHAM
eukprot:gnl/TRDRNA2_/TRDRNA2_36316_c0_seq1.p1 gnl/TRDRNA2_/TRDRNA2_36316_c0~~gnl/TRDRNA2_/TRDRNA2_36316_c0_seq1.p1  ORF type:complete len:273 (+),score=42.32 gnl/TRDRNA2_/TRDRNA2_36316_c0_seq1:127-945(+)